MTHVIFRQSQIKTWMECPLRYRFRYLDEAPGEQSSAMSFGTAIHDAALVMETSESLDAGVDRFTSCWDDLSILDIAYDYMMPRNSHEGYRAEGVRILQDWWQVHRWDSDVVLAREHQFTVPLRGTEHSLSGTADKILLRTLPRGERVLVVSDYKTGRKVPTRDYLAHDIQFTVYTAATLEPAFWADVPDGSDLFEFLQGMPRHAEWVHLRSPRRIDAGIRTAVHYNRLRYAVDQIALSIEMGIFPPTLSGAECQYCEYRGQCGLPSIGMEGEWRACA